MFKKHLWKSDILSKDAGKRPGLSMIGTLVENGLISLLGNLWNYNENYNASWIQSSENWITYQQQNLATLHKVAWKTLDLALPVEISWELEHDSINPTRVGWSSGPPW